MAHRRFITALLTAFVMLTAGTTHALPLHHADLVQQSDTSPQGFQTLQPLIGLETLSGVQSPLRSGSSALRSGSSALRSGSTVGRSQALVVKGLDGVSTEYNTVKKAVVAGTGIATMAATAAIEEATEMAVVSSIIEQTTKPAYITATREFNEELAMIALKQAQYDVILEKYGQYILAAMEKFGGYYWPEGAVIVDGVRSPEITIPERWTYLFEQRHAPEWNTRHLFNALRDDIKSLVGQATGRQASVRALAATLRTARIMTIVMDVVTIIIILSDLAFVVASIGNGWYRV
ncbi:hypothetical protein Barb6XT_02915 [Bacteroidales bacterium Barb6XT]|nr:hypothetical protein Barb6XT_02915 [Bacteroidales bacterium Barb6XT]